MNWTREQTILAFELYCRTPFGRIHTGNPDIIALAKRIRRTPSAVVFRLTNLASCDPAERARGIVGMKHRSKLDEVVFNEFASRQDALLDSATKIARSLGIPAPPQPELTPELEAEQIIASFKGRTDALRLVRVRRAQAAFRRAVLMSYQSRCAICKMSIPTMLCASHIIPWSDDESRRADPTNGIALCALHDRAFDRGLIGLDETNRILVSPQARKVKPKPILHRVGLIDIEGKSLTMPKRFWPDSVAIAYHRTEIFVAA